ncbi:hypothetical protein [Rosettibacter firmus]|uniref:hypothetical protein n=1 Tax=Rosettibacter firmus TaxID=3111522 RepID=UPI00336C09F6
MKRILFYLLFTSISNFAQLSNMGVGINTGIGEIKGNSSSVTSFGVSVYFDFNLWFTENVSFRTGYSYFRKIEYFIPEERMGRYYPFIKLFYLKSILQQEIPEYFFVEEGIGIIYLNDRTLSDTNNWQYGIAFNLATGLDLAKMKKSNLKLSIGLDYGYGLNKTNASYYLFYLSTKLIL